MKQVTTAALNVCSPIASDKISQIFVYLDGSATMCDDEPIMSWGFCCFKVDIDFNHDLFFSSGGVICTDRDSQLYFGAEKHNSFTAELYANVMARMWLLQSGIVEKSNVVFLYDNQAAALAVIGKVVSRSNCTLCKVGIAIDRLCNKLYCTSTHHTHSHDNHPWNELADAI